MHADAAKSVPAALAGGDFDLQGTAV